jgi:hypothetical protein
MSKKPKNVVGDPTDPKGTLQPNLYSEIDTGDYYKLLFCSLFDQIVNLSPGVDRTDLLAIWSLFITQESLENIVLNTNKKGASLYRDKGRYVWQWKDIDISELYAYLAILFYIGLHIENDSQLYWSQREGRLLHQAVIAAMRQQRWYCIHCAFSISDPTTPKENTTVFQRVEPLNSHVWEASCQYWIPGRDFAVDEYMERFTG